MFKYINISLSRLYWGVGYEIFPLSGVMYDKVVIRGDGINYDVFVHKHDKVMKFFINGVYESEVISKSNTILHIGVKELFIPIHNVEGHFSVTYQYGHVTDVKYALRKKILL